MKFNGFSANEDGGWGDLNTTRVFRRRGGDGNPLLVRSALGMSQDTLDSMDVDGRVPYSNRARESKGGVEIHVSDKSGVGDPPSRRCVEVRQRRRESSSAYRTQASKTDLSAIWDSRDSRGSCS